MFCEKFKDVVNENFDITKYGEQSQYFQDNHKLFYYFTNNQYNPVYLLKSNKSLKVLTELPYMVILFYNLFPEKVSTKIRLNLEKLIGVLRYLNPNFINDKEITDPKRKQQQITLFEDYLYSITKVLYLFAYILKIQGFEVILEPHSQDCVKAIKFILENLSRDNFPIRKDILGITKNMIKPFIDVSQFYLNLGIPQKFFIFSEPAKDSWKWIDNSRLVTLRS